MDLIFQITLWIIGIGLFLVTHLINNYISYHIGKRDGINECFDIINSRGNNINESDYLKAWKQAIS